MPLAKLNPDGKSIDVMYLEDPGLPGLVEVAPHVQPDWRLMNNVWEPPAVPVVIPQVVTARQIRLALLQLGLLKLATDWIANAPPEIQIEWDYANDVRRDHPMWPLAAAALNKEASDIDGLFSLAATL